MSYSSLQASVCWHEETAQLCPNTDNRDDNQSSNKGQGHSFWYQSISNIHRWKVYLMGYNIVADIIGLSSLSQLSQVHLWQLNRPLKDGCRHSPLHRLLSPAGFAQCGLHTFCDRPEWLCQLVDPCNGLGQPTTHNLQVTDSFLKRNRKCAFI